MNVLLIPARYHSTRFPGKMLADVVGVPLVVRTYRQVMGCRGFNEVKVLTDDARIADACAVHGVPCAMTPAACRNGTERCAVYATDTLDDDDLVVNVQGDEPLMSPEIPNRLRFNLESAPGEVWTAARPLKTTEEMISIDTVKCDPCNGRIADFTRTYIPGYDCAHVGVYAYSVARLREYLDKGETIDERVYKMEQLRWGEPLACIMVDYDGIGVDRPEHLKTVLERLRAT